MKKIVCGLLFLVSGFCTAQTDSTANDTCKIIVPNVITPNSETNEYLTIYHNCPLDSFHFWIFDRWGEILYDTKKLKNDNIVDWDYSKLKEDTYVYKLECVLSGKKRKIVAATNS